MSAELSNKIATKQAAIGVIGLGYVGLPLAVLFAKKGFRVSGFGGEWKKLDQLMKGISGIEAVSETELRRLVQHGALNIEHIDGRPLESQDVYIVCVPTPVDEKKQPDLTPIRDVAGKLAKISLAGKLIINESTVAPGTTREEFGQFAGKYFLACSPERIDPGNTEKNVANITKVVGGRDLQSLDLAKALYESVLSSDVVAVSSLEAAEMTKMLENTYRAVNIALVNECAQLAESIHVDILEVIEAAKTKWSFHAHYPSLGVGGHCIPVDPWYLVELGKKKRVSLPLITQALIDNESMAHFTAKKIADVYRAGMRVLVYGITYKKDVKDMRESPVMRLLHILQGMKIPVTVYDPLFTAAELQKMNVTAGKKEPVDIFVVGSDHAQLAEEYRSFVSGDTVVVDGRNFFLKKVGKKVFGIGRNAL